MTILCIREDDGMQFQTILNFPFLFKEFRIHDCMKLLISNFLDNVPYKCMCLQAIDGLQLNGAIILSAGCIQKRTMFCEV